MATTIDYDRLRRDIGADYVTLDDAAAALLFTEAESLYTGVQSLRAGVRVIALMSLIAQATKLTDYSQDTTDEKFSQVFDHLYKLLEFWQNALDRALLDETQVSTSASNQSLRIKVLSSW